MPIELIQFKRIKHVFNLIKMTKFVKLNKTMIYLGQLLLLRINRRSV
jgi:hypothetical protein